MTQLNVPLQREDLVLRHLRDTRNIGHRQAVALIFSVDPDFQRVFVVNVQDERVVAPRAVRAVLGADRHGVYVAVTRRVAACVKGEIGERIRADVMPVLIALKVRGSAGIRDRRRFAPLADLQPEQIRAVLRREAVEVRNIPLNVDDVCRVEDDVVVERLQPDLRRYGIERDCRRCGVGLSVENAGDRHVERVDRALVVVVGHHACGDRDARRRLCLRTRHVLRIDFLAAARDGNVERGGRVFVFIAQVAAPIERDRFAADGLDVGLGEVEERRETQPDFDLPGLPRHGFARNTAVRRGQDEAALARALERDCAAVAVDVRNVRVAAAPGKLRECIFFICQCIRQRDVRLILHVDNAVGGGVRRIAAVLHD